MFNRSGSSRMSGILRFNIVAAGACGSYYLWSRYSNRQSLQAEYCTKALELVQLYPDVNQLLGKKIRLTKLVTRRDSERFTDLTQLLSDSGRIRAKLEIKGTRGDGLLYVWASRAAAAPSSANMQMQTLAPEDSAGPSTVPIFDDEKRQRQQQLDTSSSSTIFTPTPSAATEFVWTIDKLSLQLRRKGHSPQWTMYQSFASMNAANEETRHNAVS